MNVKLTKRDKMLLYLLAIVLIVFGFLQLGIFPQMTRTTELEAEVGELETMQLPMEAAIMALPSMQTAYAENELALETALEDFYPYMENHEIGSMVTSLLTDTYSLTISSLSMSDTPVGTAVPVYFAAQTGEATEAAASADGENVPVLTSHVSVTATGSRSRMQALVDDLFLHYLSLRVTGYSISEQEEAGQLTLNFDLYMRTGE